MASKGFFKELRLLVKKHFFSGEEPRPAGQPVTPTTPPDDTRKTKVGSVDFDSDKIKDEGKQARIQRLCQQLIAKQDMLTSGKLQFIGLGQVKQKFGSEWASIKPIVYQTVEAVIKEYMAPEDLFVRYQEDSYIIIFAKASQEEAEIKSALIAEEIRRRMFETQRKGLEELHIKREVRTVKTEGLRDAKTLDETIDRIFSGQIDVNPRAIDNWRPTSSQEKKAQKDAIKEAARANKASQAVILDQSAAAKPKKADVKVVQVEAYKSNLRRFASQDIGKDLDFIYMPVWDVKNMALTTYICMVKTYDTDMYPFRAHKDIYRKLKHSQKLEYDLAVLNHVVQELNSIIGDKSKSRLLFCCPVHYDTLQRPSSFQKFIAACGSIPESMRKSVLFLVFDAPEQLHRMTLSAIVGPMKKYCRYVCMEVPFETALDFETLRVSGVDSIGVNLNSINADRAAVEHKLNQFALRAKRNYIPFVFILGVTDTKLVTSAVISHYDFVSGMSIHTYVNKPDTVYKFKYEDLYKGIISNKGERQ